MDIALKQRLVGASILVALGVIFIPMMLDGPGAPGRQEVTVDLPRDPEQPVRRFEVNSAEPGARQASPGQVTTPERIDRHRDPPEVRPRPDITAIPKPSESAATGSPSSAEVTAGNRQGAENSASVPDPAIEPTASAKPAQSQGQSGRGWVLQLGSFGNAANAEKVVAKVAAEGFNAFQEKTQVGGQTLYRVRVGHWLDRNEAANAGALLGQRFADMTPTLSWDDSTGAAPPVAAQRGYMVQVGAFGQQANASGLRDKLRAAGYSAHVSPAGDKFRVLVGPEFDKASAEDRRDSLKDTMKLSGIVISHP